MSSDLERRLEGLLAELPEPEPDVGEMALAAAVAALRAAPPARRGIRTAAVVFAAGLVLLAIAAGSLAAAGALHVSLGGTTKPRPSHTVLSLPAGTNGIAVVVDGELDVVTKSGFRLQGLRVSAAALSPHALYIAAGIGHSLVAMAPDGRRAWSHPAGGTVVAISWAPFGNRIAYIVHRSHRSVLHVIWGNGTNDTVVDRSVRSVRASWRADSLAFAYVGSGGRAIVYDLGHQSHRLAAAATPVAHLAFAPTGRTLALATPDSLTLIGGKSPTRVSGLSDVEAIGWLRRRLVLALEAGVTPPIVRVLSRSGATHTSFRVYGRVLAVTHGFVVTFAEDEVVAGQQRVLSVRRGQSVGEVEIR